MEGIQLVELIAQMGLGGIGFVFFWFERKSHIESVKEHIKDLREMAHVNQTNFPSASPGPTTVVYTDATKVPTTGEMVVS